MTDKTEALHEQEAAYIYRLAEDLEIDYCGDVVAHNAAAELRRLSIENDALGLHLSERMKDLARVEAQRNALLGLLKEARKIIRATSSRNLVKDWDQRTTDVIKAVEENT